MNRDFVEMLSALSAERARFLVVGAHALAAHGTPRATGDLDLFIDRSPENVARVLAALRSFGAPLLDLTAADLEAADTVFQIGVVPCRIDILTGISGVTFAEAWNGQVTLSIEGVSVPVIGRDEFIRNKRSSGRPKDLADLALLGETEPE